MQSTYWHHITTDSNRIVQTHWAIGKLNRESVAIPRLWTPYHPNAFTATLNTQSTAPPCTKPKPEPANEIPPWKNKFQGIESYPSRSASRSHQCIRNIEVSGGKGKHILDVSLKSIMIRLPGMVDKWICLISHYPSLILYLIWGF